jgi:CO/xanthine dehydrogenase FAD-binding subunit
MLPALPEDAHAAYEKIARTPADLPIVCVAALESADMTRIALGGVGDQMVVIDADSPTVEEAVELAQASIEPPTDYFASSDYRREMIGVLVKRVLA